MLTDAALERILERLSRLTVAVLGDLFLDRYLQLDAALTEPSLETGLDAYQVVRVRSDPGAAGTVINNLAAFGVRAIHVIAVLGDDGEGYELRQALCRLTTVDAAKVLTHPQRRTPTYTKPMLHTVGQPPRELNRLDVKNRHRLPHDAEADVLRSLDALWPELDAVLLVDQVSEPDCGVVTGPVRRRLGELGQADPARVVLADSRAHIGLFENVCLKPNAAECRRAVGGTVDAAAAAALARRARRPVFCTQGEAGILVVAPPDMEAQRVAGYPVAGPIDPVGAGDSTSAAIACALASGAGPVEAAAFGNLVASITVQQIGMTGTATPDQIRQRWKEVKQQG